MHDKILRFTAWIMSLLWLLCVLTLDSKSWIPFVGLVITSTWLALFITINQEYLEKKARERK